MMLSTLNLLATAPGGVARLRELILTLAVQGKLVAQEAGDEPASELLKQIRAEKDWLIAAKKLKREKDDPALTDDALPFNLPASWIWVALGEVIDIVRGITFPASQKTREAAPGRIACLRTSNVQQTIEWEDLLFVDRSFMGREDQLIQHHDIVMSMANSRELVGKVALIDQIPHAEATFGGFLGVLRPRKIDPRYAMAVLRTPYARSLLIDSSSQTTNIANVSLGKLRPLPFPLPPEAEQSSIVTRVEELMRLCDALEAKGRLEAAQHAQLVTTLLGTLTESDTPAQLAENWQRLATHFDLLLDRPQAVDALEQTILQLAVRGLLVPQDPTDEPASALLKKIRMEKDRLIAAGQIKRDKPLAAIAENEQPFALPSGWECARLDVLSIVVVDCPHSTAKFVSKGVLCIDTNSFKDGALLPHKLRYVDVATFTERIARLQPEPGDLVFAREGSVGESLIIPDGVVACLGQRVMLFRFSKNVSNEFVRLVITSKVFLDNLLTLHKGIGAKHVNVGDMRLSIVPLPPLPEQSRIVTRVAQLRRLCADLRQRLATSQATQAQLAEALVQQPSSDMMAETA